jgi:hypothetical protein
VLDQPFEIVPLEQGIGMLPLPDDLLDAIQALEPWERVQAESRFDFVGGLHGRFAVWVADLSAAGMVAYLEIDLSAGVGTRMAVVWESGRTVLGPLTQYDEEAEGTPLPQNPINQALRYIGVTTGDELDEFDALRLGRYRRTEDW